MYSVNAAVLERWDSLSDEDVVANVLEGQTALFEILMRRHNNRRSAFSTWLIRIGVNEAISRARRRGRYEPLGDGDHTPFASITSMRPTADPERQAFAREFGVERKRRQNAAAARTRRPPPGPRRAHW